MRKKTPFENYTLLLIKIDKMRNTPFKVTPFLKAIQPYCKTTKSTNGKQITFRVKGAKVGVYIVIKENYFEVVQCCYVHEFHFYLTSGKSLLQKLIKHNLLKP